MTEQKTIEKVKQLSVSVKDVAKQYGFEQKLTMLDALIKKVEEQRITLLVCGEFKRGKSSLINAFLNENVCPEAEGIATSVVSIISYGNTRKVLRHYGNIALPSQSEEGGESANIESHVEEIPFEDIAKYADGSVSDIEHTIMLEIFIPNERLKGGLTIIDTPGVGSLDPRHLMLTLHAIPKADILYFISDVDEPLGASELEFYQQRVYSTGKVNRILVNKADLRRNKEVQTIIQDIERKTKCPGERILPVSARYWKDFNSEASDELERKSHSKEVCAAIETDCKAAQDHLAEVVRSQFLDILESLYKSIELHKNELSDLTPLNEKKAQYQQQISELKQLHDNITNPYSEFRQKISRILKDSQQKVLSTFSQQSVLLSTDELDKILQSSEAKASNGDQYVTQKINDAIVKLSSNLDEGIEKGMQEVVSLVGKEMNIPGGSFSGIIKSQITPVQHSLSEKAMSTVRQSIPLMGVATLSGLAVSVVAPVVALPVGIVAGIAFVAKNIFDTSRQERVNNIRRQISPRIQIAINEMQRYIQNRYEKFNEILIQSLNETANQMLQSMQEIVNSIKQCEVGAQERQTEIKKITSQMKFIEGLIAQTKVFNTNPFAVPQAHE